MYFYIDESGHTGQNIFDENQPELFYGCLSSSSNLDNLADDTLSEARKIAGVDRLHANELGETGISAIAPVLTKIQNKFDLKFNFYSVNKVDYASMCFFDLVFVQGSDRPVPWRANWTSLRYPLLLHLSNLFEFEALKIAWNLRSNPNDDEAESSLIVVCSRLLENVSQIPDERVKEIIRDALTWAIQNPTEFLYNAKRDESALPITPNGAGFQLVMLGIAHRLKNYTGKELDIVVDRQTQFNKAQVRLSDWYSQLSERRYLMGPRLSKDDLRGMPKTPIRFSSGVESCGLELVDIYLWIFKRLIEGPYISSDLVPFLEKQLQVLVKDEISLSALSERREP